MTVQWSFSTGGGCACVPVRSQVVLVQDCSVTEGFRELSGPGARAVGAWAHHTAHGGGLTAMLQVSICVPETTDYYLLGP